MGEYKSQLQAGEEEEVLPRLGRRAAAVKAGEEESCCSGWGGGAAAHSCEIG